MAARFWPCSSIRTCISSWLMPSTSIRVDSTGWCPRCRPSDASPYASWIRATSWSSVVTEETSAAPGPPAPRLSVSVRPDEESVVVLEVVPDEVAMSSVVVLQAATPDPGARWQEPVRRL